MRTLFINFTILVTAGIMGWFSYQHLTSLNQLIGIFITGIVFGCFLMNIKLNVKNKRINSYKRELEKESISSTESEAKVKVLESKIEVLEKALENALKNR